MVDASGASVGAVAHTDRGVLSFPQIWSLYTAISGQAIPSAFGLFSSAATHYAHNLTNKLEFVRNSY